MHDLSILRKWDLTAKEWHQLQHSQIHRNNFYSMKLLKGFFFVFFNLLAPTQKICLNNLFQR